MMQRQKQGIKTVNIKILKKLFKKLHHDIKSYQVTIWYLRHIMLFKTLYHGVQVTI